HPVYQFLKSQPQGKGMLGDAIKWNFTKVLVDPHGKVVDRFAPTKAPQDLEPDIKALLAQQ
ncbi:glutathione peroxidase, partial [Mycobacterium tuberculosis]|nr:glutathione peroxidase [Mycobacterium tuberculosis]